MTQQTFRAVVGANLKRLREKKKLSQDRLARDLREAYNLPWTQATVAAIETGRRELSAGEWLKLEDRFGGFRVGRRALLSDSVDEIRTVDFEGFEMEADEWAAFVAGKGIEGGYRGDPKDIIELDSHGTVERDAARAIGKRLKRKISPLEISRTAHALWGKGLGAKREEMLGKSGTASGLRARRGHVSRDLQAEIQERIERRPLEKERAK